MGKKIVFFDIDGTILDDNKEIPESTIKAIRLLQENGVYVAIATGRAPFMTRNICETLNIESFVCYNGQYIVYEGQVIYERTLDKQELEQLHHMAAKKEIPMIFMGQKEMCATVKGHPFISDSIGSLKIPYPRVDASYYQNEKIYQALIFSDKKINDVIQTREGIFNYIRWHEYCLDVLPIGGSKAEGIRMLIDKAGFSNEDTIAFGDGLNDMEMIQLVGKGIAMGNAVSELKHVSDYVTRDVNNNGIWQGLKYLQLI